MIFLRYVLRVASATSSGIRSHAAATRRGAATLSMLFGPCDHLLPSHFYGAVSLQEDALVDPMLVELCTSS